MKGRPANDGSHGTISKWRLVTLSHHHAAEQYVYEGTARQAIERAREVSRWRGGLVELVREGGADAWGQWVVGVTEAHQPRPDLHGPCPACGDGVIPPHRAAGWPTTEGCPRCLSDEAYCPDCFDLVGPFRRRCDRCQAERFDWRD